jgi:hypothetical protein
MSDPLMRHKLVRMVDRVNRIHANPYHRLGLRLEDSVIYCDNVRRHMERLTLPVRNAVILMAEGHTAQMAAELSGVSPKVLRRSLDQVWVN